MSTDQAPRRTGGEPRLLTRVRGDTHIPAETVVRQFRVLTRPWDWAGAPLAGASAGLFVRSLPETQAMADWGSGLIFALGGAVTAIVVVGALAWRGTAGTSRSVLKAYRRKSAASSCLALLVLYPLLLETNGEAIRSHARGELFLSAYLAVFAVTGAWLAGRARA